MRTIKFRGKKVNNSEWVYGYYVYRPNGAHLIYWKPFDEATNNTYHEVDPSTVGQYTGIKDFGGDGKEIYEGDYWISDKGKMGIVQFHDTGKWIMKFDTWEQDLWDWVHNNDEREIIGTIHEQKD